MTNGYLETGISERRLLKTAGKGTSYLAIQAAKTLFKGNINPKK
jgi:hypothetical protein